MRKTALMTQNEEGFEMLVLPKANLKVQISEQLEIGEEIIARKIENQTEYNKCWEDFLDWDDYNLELFKQIFNNQNNSYYREYMRSSGGGGLVMLGRTREPSFQENIVGLKAEMGHQVKKIQLFYKKIDLLKSTVITNNTEPDQSNLPKLLSLLGRFHKIAQELRDRRSGREPVTIKDEYDVQYLLNALLYIHFSDIRKEDFSPSHAGANSRIDFVLKRERIIIEVKVSSERLGVKELGEQLLIDIGRYKEYPDCDDLVIFIYDKGDHIRNKTGLIADLQKQSVPGLKVTVVITPE